ncbi:hypothetical protein Kfla_3879 [Kribbella flavida DSM 17836]|uniref:Uncharacterized protein n=1 Tax=Kribbella flavida (strain DSM 17836 / JCM 10339 / NBRC 14399) TaxID=479435 RepID=D2PQ08_KRIFD|nr:hypothetical protein [Kribbella flavida]ADB32932.1 hypothetical protein Kfla_3879 [Kribbella flavida DSM 17836]
MDEQPSWREQRREASAAHAAALERRRAAETEKARALLADFIREMQARGIEPQPLRAPVVGSGTSYRTGITGWYLRRNRSLGVDADGNFYILGTTAGLTAHLLGVKVLPSDPPLTIGLGARDGESLPLAELLQLRLDEVDAQS